MGGQTLQNWMEGMCMCMVIAQVRWDPWKVRRGGGTGQTDLVEEVERLDKENEEDRVQVGLWPRWSGQQFWT